MDRSEPNRDQPDGSSHGSSSPSYKVLSEEGSQIRRLENGFRSALVILGIGFIITLFIGVVAIVLSKTSSQLGRTLANKTDNLHKELIAIRLELGLQKSNFEEKLLQHEKELVRQQYEISNLTAKGSSCQNASVDAETILQQFQSAISNLERNQQKSDSADLLTGIRNETKGLKETLIQLQIELSEVKVKGNNDTFHLAKRLLQLKSDHKRDFQTQRRMLTTLQDEIENLNGSISRLKLTDDTKIAITFTAVIGKLMYAFKLNQPIVFDKVLLNSGGGYNSHTGKFTCPESGLYVFSITLANNRKNPFRANIVRGRTPLASTLIEAIAEVQTSNSVAIACQTGQQIWIEPNKLVEALGTSVKHATGTSGSHCATFTGYKLS